MCCRAVYMEKSGLGLNEYITSGMVMCAARAKLATPLHFKSSWGVHSDFYIIFHTQILCSLNFTGLQNIELVCWSVFTIFYVDIFVASETKIRIDVHTFLFLLPKSDNLTKFTRAQLAPWFLIIITIKGQENTFYYYHPCICGKRGSWWNLNITPLLRSTHVSPAFIYDHENSNRMETNKKNWLVINQNGNTLALPKKIMLAVM